MSDDILDPKVDFVFKQLFGSENHKDILIAFLNSIFGNKGTEEEIVEIIIENPEIDKNWDEDKQSRLDIKATTNNDSRVNIEIQLKNQFNMKRRTLYYWSKLYESQIKSGDEYEDLQKTITINILNFDYLGNNRYHNAYILKEVETNEVLTNLQEIHFIELSKLNESDFKNVEELECESGNDNLLPWALFLKNPKNEVVEMIEERLEELKEAAERLEMLSHDEETREIYESRQKAIHDQISNIKGAARKARKDEKRKTAKNLLALGVDTEKIKKATGLSEKEIDSLA